MIISGMSDKENENQKCYSSPHDYARTSWLSHASSTV